MEAAGTLRGAELTYSDQSVVRESLEPPPARRGSAPRVVIAHDFAEIYGGAERIVAEIADLFPDAPFWTILGRRSVAKRMGVEDRFHSILPENESLLTHYRGLAPIFPTLVRSMQLPEADVLITSSYAFAHGFRTRNRAPQVCYCYSPLRFAWSMTPSYRREWARGKAVRSRAFDLLVRFMRRQDRRAAGEVARYLTESDFTAEQIERFYGKSATAIGAPVDCQVFHPPVGGHDGYYLFCGRLVETYKRPSAVIRAFHSLPHDRLVIAGDGPSLPALREMAGPNVEFVGHVHDSELVPLMQRCKAAIFPSRDDFGLIPLEVMACGRPVLAYAGGGALRTVVPGKTGEFFVAQTPRAVLEAVRAFDSDRYDSDAIRAHALGWDRLRFRETVQEVVEETLALQGSHRLART